VACTGTTLTLPLQHKVTDFYDTGMVRRIRSLLAEA